MTRGTASISGGGINGLTFNRYCKRRKIYILQPVATLKGKLPE